MTIWRPQTTARSVLCNCGVVCNNIALCALLNVVLNDSKQLSWMSELHFFITPLVLLVLGLIPFLSPVQRHHTYMRSWLHVKLEKVALDGSVECCAPPPRWCDLELWPFVTFWPQNLINSSLSQDAPVTKVWRKSVNRYWRHRGNIKLPRESRTDGRTTRKHIASTGGGGLIKQLQMSLKCFNVLFYM